MADLAKEPDQHAVSVAMVSLRVVGATGRQAPQRLGLGFLVSHFTSSFFSRGKSLRAPGATARTIEPTTHFVNARPAVFRYVFPMPKPSDYTPIDIAKFWSRVEAKSDFQCWTWRGARSTTGYGRTNRTVAHRVAYELVNGPIPRGMVIRHTCDNPPCCNPRHLVVGTHLDNSRDAIERGRAAMGERNGRTRISADQAAYIRANPDGLSLAQLAAAFGMAQSSIFYIRSGRSWKTNAAKG